MIRNNRIHIGFFTRLIAFYIDIFIIGIIVFIILFLIGLITRFSVNEFNGFEEIFGKIGLSIIVQGTGFITMGFYYIILHWKFGATIGKMAFKIKLVNTEYKKINLKTSFIRFLLFLISVSVFGLGCLLIFFNNKKQSFHDIIAKTLVVYLIKNGDGSDLIRKEE